MRGRRRYRAQRRPRIPPSASIAPVAQHRGGNAQLACDLAQRPTAAHQQGYRFLLELIRKMTPSLAHSTPFRSRRSLAKVSTNSGEPQAKAPRTASSPYSALVLAFSADCRLTIRGGGKPYSNMALMPTERMGPPPGASPPMRMAASWSGSNDPTAYKSVARRCLQWRAPLGSSTELIVCA